MGKLNIGFGDGAIPWDCGGQVLPSWVPKVVGFGASVKGSDEIVRPAAPCCGVKLMSDRLAVRSGATGFGTEAGPFQLDTAEVKGAEVGTVGDVVLSPMVCCDGNNPKVGLVCGAAADG